MGRRITQKEKEEMVTLRKLHYTCKEIAERYGVSVASVHQNTRDVLGVLRGKDYRGSIPIEFILEEMNKEKKSLRSMAAKYSIKYQYLWKLVNKYYKGRKDNDNN